jgi:hypothetical protein
MKHYAQLKTTSLGTWRTEFFFPHAIYFWNLRARVWQELKILSSLKANKVVHTLPLETKDFITPSTANRMSLMVVPVPFLASQIL